MILFWKFTFIFLEPSILNYGSLQRTFIHGYINRSIATFYECAAFMEYLSRKLEINEPVELIEMLIGSRLFSLV